MRTFVTLCDICIADGKVRLAKLEYVGDEGVKYHACSTHAKNIREYQLPITQVFDAPGNVDVYDLG